MDKKKHDFMRDYFTSLDSEYKFSTDFTRAGKIGATGSVQTPNQIGELTSRLNQGLKAVEVGTMNQRLMDQIPKEHFTEMRRLSKLTGSEATLHAPIQDLDLAGFTQQGWNNFERLENIEKLKSVIDRAHLLDDKGNIPITVHAGGLPVQKWKKSGLLDEEGKEAPDTRSEMAIVNQDTGQMQLVKYDVKEYASGKKVVWTPQRRVENLNGTSWDQEQHQLMQLKKDLIEVEDRFSKDAERYSMLIAADKKKLLTEDEKKELGILKNNEKRAAMYGRETYQMIRSQAEEMYNRFNKFKTEPETEEDRNMYKQFKNNVKIISEHEEEIEKLSRQAIKIDQEREAIKNKTGDKYKELTEEYHEKVKNLNEERQNQTELMIDNFSNMPAPNTWVSADDFAKEQVSDSVAEAALHAYKEYGENAPIISMENVYPEFTLSRADSLRDAIEKSREKFAEGLVDSKKWNLSEKKAKEIAEKLIGVTWDVGHIYMLRKHGYSDEDIKNEVKKIAKYVKHIHLTDNFGFEDSHLPPGSGKVNIKEQLEEIQKALEKGDFEKINSIVEAGEFVANFKEVPHLYALSHLDSPFYSSKSSAPPYWRDIWESPSGYYFTGFGETMPQKYFDLYGAPGFSQLPSSLGGAGSSTDRGRLASSEES